MSAATQKAVVDSVRAALEDPHNADRQECGHDADADYQEQQQQQQQQQIEAVESPAGQQASSGKRMKKKRRGSGTADTMQVGTAEANLEADAEARSHPGSCQAVDIRSSMQKVPEVLHRTQHKAAPVRTSAFKQRPDALAKQVCPAYDNPAVHVLSLCHLPDVHADHSCKMSADCGVDSMTCRDRACSVHAFCQEDPK